MSGPDYPTDQETKANEALGALNGLHDLIANQPVGSSTPSEDIVYLIKLCIYSCERAIPDGLPKHRRAVNDIDTG